MRGGRGHQPGSGSPGAQGGLLPYHVGIRGGHDVGVNAVGSHGAPQSGEPRRCVGGRRGQVLVAQGDMCWGRGGNQLQRLGLGGMGVCDPTWGVPGRGRAGHRGAHRWVRGAVPDVRPGGGSLRWPSRGTAWGHGDTPQPQAAARGPADLLFHSRASTGAAVTLVPSPKHPASPALGLLAKNSVSSPRNNG